MKKTYLQPAGGANPNHIVLDKTVIQINDKQHWLYAAVDIDTNRLLHIRLYPTKIQVLTEMLLSKLREKYLVDDTLFLVNSTPWLQATLDRHGLRFKYERHGYRDSVRHVFRKVKRQTYQFSNYFSHANPETAGSLLQAFAVLHNALI